VRVTINGFQCCRSGSGSVAGIQVTVFPDPGSETHIFDSIMTNFWVKSTGTAILSVLAKKICLPVQKLKLFTILRYLWLPKNCRKKKNSPSSFGAVV
jgi:hypothetical protein